MYQEAPAGSIVAGVLFGRPGAHSTPRGSVTGLLLRVLFTVGADEPVYQVGHFGSHVTEVIGTDQPDVRDTPGRGKV